jgi:uncharacterized phage protein gp47/JayE
MPDLPTRLDYFSIGREVVVQKSTKIDPAQVDIEGSDANLFVGIAAVLADQITKQLAFRTASLLLDGADDEDLDRYAYDRYNLTRKGASAARGSVVFTRTSVAAGAGSVPIGTKLRTDTGIEYVTTTVGSFGVSQTTSDSVNVRAVQAGKATQVGPNAINRVAQPQLLWDATLAVSNPKTTAGGENAEDDETFRARVRDFWRTARRGILAAIEQGALTVEGVVSAHAVESLTGSGDPARVVFLYISDSSGVASDALAEEVKIALDDYRAAGIAVLISTSTPLIVDIQLRLAFLAGVDTRTLTDQIRAAVVEFVNSLAVNGPLYYGQLFSVLQRYVADGLILDQGTIVAPVGDLVPPVGQTIRTTLANVTVVSL